ncbi:hypothetical protein [Celeribacter halophilus]|uniref:hypothetical protein n=1 Tax=Celeribacter halophilus TaxID=576117 RepID=UPI003A94FDDB
MTRFVHRFGQRLDDVQAQSRTAGGFLVEPLLREFIEEPVLYFAEYCYCLHQNLILSPAASLKLDADLLGGFHRIEIRLVTI